MSSITNIVIYSSLREPYLDACPVDIKNVAAHAGGSKVMAPVYVGAINYIDAPAFVDWFNAPNWREPEMVVLIVDHEHNDNILTITNGELLVYENGLFDKVLGKIIKGQVVSGVAYLHE